MEMGQSRRRRRDDDDDDDDDDDYDGECFPFIFLRTI